MKTLENRCVILGVTGSIAAYKACDIASTLTKEGCDTHVIMTKNATRIVTPITFSTLTGNNCLTKTFDASVNYNVAHVALAKRADLLVVAPASANVIAKLAAGIADDMLTTTALACQCPKIIAPAMNTAMYENPVTQKNLKALQELGWRVIEPDSGVLACKDVGKGKFPPPSVIVDEIHREIEKEKDLAGKRVLVTAGPTQEAIDPVRFVSNHSSGKMGYALARDALLRGAEVTLVSGPVEIEAFPGIHVIPVTSAQEMFDAVTSRSDEMDIIIKAAAVADFTPATVSDQKIKKESEQSMDHGLMFRRTQDILAWLGEHKKENQILCGFCMETHNLRENAESKLIRKNADMICANSLNTEGAGFQGDTNVITMMTRDEVIDLPLQSKDEVSAKILDQILKLSAGKSQRKDKM